MNFVNLNRTFGPPENSENDYAFLQAEQSGQFGQSWDEMLDSQLVVVLASASSGKTAEFEHQARRLSQNGKMAVFCAIEELATNCVEDVLTGEESECIAEWKQGNGTGYFFLDAVDEAKLTDRHAYKRALRKFRKYLGDHASRAHVFVSSRPSDWHDDDPATLRTIFEKTQATPVAQDAVVHPLTEAEVEAALAAPVVGAGDYDGSAHDTTDDDQLPNEAPPTSPKIVVLNPMSNVQQRQFAEERGNVQDADTFMLAVEKQGLEPFAKRPGDLLSLSTYWNTHGEFGTLAEMVEEGIVRLLSEEKSLRDDQDALTEFEAMDGAMRLAAGLILCRKHTITAPGTQAFADDNTALRPADILPDWTPKQREVLLRRGLFSPASIGRVRFQHRSSIEFLAARWMNRLLTDERFRHSVWQMLFPTDFGVETVTPEFRPTVAWLALWNDNILDEILKREPIELVRYGDPKAMSIQTRARLLQALSEREKAGDVSDDQVDQRSVWAFADPRLAPAIRAAWVSNESVRFRVLLLRMIAEAHIHECADLATEAATQSVVQRPLLFRAIEVLVELDDSASLEIVANALKNGVYGNSPRDLAELSLTLFPDFIDVNELVNLIHSAAPPKRYELWGFGRQLKRLYESSSVADGERFIGALANLALQVPYRSWHERVSKQYGYLARDFGGIAVAALARMKDPSESAALIRMLMAAERTNEKSYANDHDEIIRNQVNKDIDLKRALFWADVREVRSERGDQVLLEKPWMAFRISHHGRYWNLTLDDQVWLSDAAQDESLSFDDRATVYYALIEIFARANLLSEKASFLELLAKDSDLLTSWLRRELQPPPKDELEIMHEEREAEYEAKQLREEESAIASWSRYRSQLLKATPVADFSRGISAESWQMIHDLSRWLGWKSNQRESESPRGWRELVPVFGQDVADTYVELFRLLWRHEKPLRPKWTGSQCTTKYVTLYSFAGIGIEADLDEQWAMKLSATDADRACRHMLLSGQNVPDWFDDLFAQHKAVVLPLLRAELKREWRSKTDHAYTWLDYLAYYEGALPSCLGDIAVSVIIRNRPGDPKKWSKGIQIVEKIGLGTKQWARLGRLARNELGNVGVSTTDRIRFIGVLCVKDINSAVQILEDELRTADNEVAEEILGRLFAERYDGVAHTALSSATVSTLERLIELTFRHIAPSDDLEREGARAVSRRDYAEDARGAILNALLSHPSELAYQAVRRFSIRSEIASSQQRFSVFSKRMVERATTWPEWKAKDVVRFERDLYLPIKSATQFFELVSSVVGSIQEDFQQQDATSKRVIHRAADEVEVQEWLAEQLHLRAKSRFHRIREPEVAAANKPDLVLVSTETDAQISIEVKHSDKGWSARDLQRSITNQLIGKYLRPENRRQGLLVVTRHKKNYWLSPTTGRRINFLSLIDLLQVFAEQAANSHTFTVSVRVVGIDTR